MVLGQLEPNPNRPDMFGLQWSLLPNNASLIPSGTTCANGW